MHYLYITGMW